MAETMEQYMSKTRADYGSGVSRPKIKDMDNFELKGQFLKELPTNTFSGSDHEDANEHTEKVLEIVDLCHIPNITIDQVMLRAFPMSLTGATSRWLRNEPIEMQECHPGKSPGNVSPSSFSVQLFSGDMSPGKGGGGHGVPHGGSKVVVSMIPLMIMNANSDSYRDSAPPPDNARSQHTISLQQVIVTILGAAAVLCFSNDLHACIIFESGIPNREQEYAPSRPTKSPKNTFLIDPR
ncbi:hypothetical protein Tco_0856923 [Tanacetum coccineum]|uniref:Uncharacterized protein n=1 Tax=Tanacetum coccineum TaxID=301880 RepID=A0ABQ5B5I0_9ASTR